MRSSRTRSSSRISPQNASRAGNSFGYNFVNSLACLRILLYADVIAPPRLRLLGASSPIILPPDGESIEPREAHSAMPSSFRPAFLANYQYLPFANPPWKRRTHEAPCL